MPAVKRAQLTGQTNQRKKGKEKKKVDAKPLNLINEAAKTTGATSVGSSVSHFLLFAPLVSRPAAITHLLTNIIYRHRCQRCPRPLFCHFSPTGLLFPAVPVALLLRAEPNGAFVLLSAPVTCSPPPPILYRPAPPLPSLPRAHLRVFLVSLWLTMEVRWGGKVGGSGGCLLLGEARTGGGNEEPAPAERPRRISARVFRLSPD